MRDTDWRPSRCPTCGEWREAAEFPACQAAGCPDAGTVFDMKEGNTPARKEKLMTAQENHDLESQDASETNAARFKRIANSRLNTAETAIAALAKTYSTASYEYTPEQVETIAKVLQQAVDDCLDAFRNGGERPAAARL